MESITHMIGWDSSKQEILTFTKNDEQLINIIKEYGNISKNKLLTKCDIFINGSKSNQQTAQNNIMWVECIKASLSKAARQQVLAYCDTYEIFPTVATHKIVVTPLLYKKVMQLAALDSTATNATLHKNIFELTQYSITCGVG